MILSIRLERALTKLGARWHEGSYQSQGSYPGEQTHYFAFEPALPKGQVTVLLHGAGNDALFAFDGLILRLLGLGRSVLCCDLPGYGRLSSTLLDRQRLAAFGSTLEAILSKLWPQATAWEVVGYSLGAQLALMAEECSAVSWQRLVLLSLPDCISITPQLILGEAAAPLSIDFWRQWHQFGWKSALPALGPWRRSEFPVRYAGEAGESYFAMLDSIFRQGRDRLIRSAASGRLRLIYGSWDKLARPPKEAELQGLWQMVPKTNHLTLPMAPACWRLIEEWLLTSP